MVNQGCMALSTYYLEYGRHLEQLRRCRRRRRRRRRAYAPTSNTASQDNHEKINSWAVPFLSHMSRGLGSATKTVLVNGNGYLVGNTFYSAE